jgi:prepilin-type N-terminal cleavage/methylation domain-containing protein
MQRRHLGACAHDDSERGFTLIELMVVVMIIAILIAILIPTFLGASKRANNRAAQADLRNGLTAEKTVYADGQTYLDSQSAANIATLKGIEAQLNWQSTGSTAPKALIVTVGDAVTVGDKGVVCLTETSKTTDARTSSRRHARELQPWRTSSRSLRAGDRRPLKERGPVVPAGPSAVGSS